MRAAYHFLAQDKLDWQDLLQPHRDASAPAVARVRTELPDDQSGTVQASVVLACEIDAPAGVKPVQWRLLTNRLVETPEQAVELIDWYRARWEIERLFHTLKNGCRIEQLQLDSLDKLERAIAVYLVVSWRIGYLMRLSRDEHASQRPKLKEVVRLIAMLGGFIGRKGDGEPRVKTLWQGMHDLRRAVEAADILREVERLD
jgi:hypothetical protein